MTKPNSSFPYRSVLPALVVYALSWVWFFTGDPMEGYWHLWSPVFSSPILFFIVAKVKNWRWPPEPWRP